MPIVTAATADEALTQAREQRPQVILLDIALSPYSGSQEGLEILPQLSGDRPARQSYHGDGQ